MHWMPSANAIAQASHFAIAWAIVLSAVHLRRSPWCGFAAVILWAAVKEYTFDLLVERDTLAGSTLDFIFYAVGGAAAVAFVRLFPRQQE